MALPQQDAEVRNDDTTEASTKERASSSSSDGGGVATPPPQQQMDRHSSSSSDGEPAPDPGRIPAEVFQREPGEPSSKDWSMMSTDSVFGLQVAPSSDFTGFFLAHPELMDISTPLRASMVNAADADVVLVPPFESFPELSDATMKGNYSFAFPNLIEDKRHSSKKVQDEQPLPTTAAPTEATKDEPAPAEAETTQASSKPEAAPPENDPAKGGLFACFPCCS